MAKRKAGAMKEAADDDDTTAGSASASTSMANSPDKKRSRKQDDHEDDDVVIVASTSKSNGKAGKKGSTATNSTKANSKKAKPAAAPAKKQASPKKVPKKKRAETFDEWFDEWYPRYADPDDESRVDGEGIERMFNDLELSMEGVAPILLAYIINSKPATLGTFAKDDLQKHLRSLATRSDDELKTVLVEREKQLYEPDMNHDHLPNEGADESTETKVKTPFTKADFRSFYTFVFNFVKGENQRSLESETACAIWSIVLAPHNELAAEFVEYASELGPQKFRGVSKDVWNELVSFCSTVEPDLTGYSEDDAWPAMFDSFVEWKKGR